MIALASAAVSGMWKLAAIVLLAALVLTGAGLGGGWYLATRDRDEKQAELVAEREQSAKYRDEIAEQNRAIDALAIAKSEADVRVQAAQRVAAMASASTWCRPRRARPRLRPAPRPCQRSMPRWRLRDEVPAADPAGRLRHQARDRRGQGARLRAMRQASARPAFAFPLVDAGASDGEKVLAMACVTLLHFKYEAQLEAVAGCL